MELRHLRYFVTVAEEGHLGRAATRLRVAPSALSSQLRDLERELGAELFVRRPRGLRLTEAGHVFREHAQRSIAAAEEGARAVRSTVQTAVAGRVRIGLPDWGDRAARIGRGLDALRRAHPDVVVDFDPSPWMMHAAALVAGTMDVGFAAGAPDADFGEELVAEWLAVEWWNSALLSASHPAAARATVRLADLRDLPLLLPPRESHPVAYDRVVAGIRRFGGFEPRVDTSSTSASAAAMTIAAGAGWIIGFESMGAALPPGTVLRRIADVREEAAFVALRRRGDERPIVRTLIEHVRAAFAEEAESRAEPRAEPDVPAVAASNGDGPGPH